MLMMMENRPDDWYRIPPDEVLSALIAMNNGGVKVCTCASGLVDESRDMFTQFGPESKGCYLAGGRTSSGVDLTGLRCVMEVGGVLDWGKEGSEVNGCAGGGKCYDVEDSLKGGVGRDEAKLVCLSKGGEGEVTTELSVWGGQSKVLAHMNLKTGEKYIADITGSDGTFFRPVGLTGSQGDEFVTLEGTRFNETLEVFSSEVRRPLTLEFRETYKIGEGVRLAKFTLREKAFWGKEEGGDFDAEAKGSGSRFGGVNAVKKENNVTGLINLYTSGVNFFNADPKLLDPAQSNIELWSCSKILVTLEGCDRVDKTWLSSRSSSLEFYLGVEPSTGVVMDSHARLTGSVEVGDSVANVVTLLFKGGYLTPIYAYDDTFELKGTQAYNPVEESSERLKGLVEVAWNLTVFSTGPFLLGLVFCLCVMLGQGARGRGRGGHAKVAIAGGDVGGLEMGGMKAERGIFADGGDAKPEWEDNDDNQLDDDESEFASLTPTAGKGRVEFTFEKFDDF